MGRGLNAEEVDAVRGQLQDLLESASYYTGEGDHVPELIATFYTSKVDAYETELAIIEMALKTPWIGVGPRRSNHDQNRTVGAAGNPAGT